MRAAHRQSGGNAPVEFDVGEHVLLGKRVTGEGQAHRLAHQAVCPLGRHQVFGRDPAIAVGVAQGGGHAGVVGGDVDEFHPATDRRTEGRQVLPQQLLGRVLRQADEAVGHLFRHREGELARALAVDVHHLAAHRQRGAQHRLDHADLIPDLERSRLDADRLRPRRDALALVDDQHVDAAPPQLDRGHEADRACAHHDHLGVHGAQITAPSARARHVAARSQRGIRRTGLTASPVFAADQAPPKSSKAKVVTSFSTREVAAPATARRVGG